MKKKWFRKSFISYVLPIFIVVVLFGAIMIYFLYNSLLDEVNKNNENLLIQIQTNVETIINEVNSLSLNFDFYTKKSDFIDGKEVMDEKRVIEQEMLNYINTLSNSRIYIHSIYMQLNDEVDRFIVSNEGMTTSTQFLDSSWLEDAQELKQKEEMTWIKSRQIKRYSFEEPTNVITVYRKLYYGIRQVGTVALNIRSSYLDERLSKLDLLAGQDIAIYTNQGDKIYSFTNGSDENDFNKKYITVESADEEYCYISRVPMRNLYKFTYQICINIAIILILSLIPIAIASYITSKRKYERVYTIYRIIAAADSSMPLPELQPKVKDEYGYIIQNMVKVFVEGRLLKEELINSKSKYESMELLALQSQINPHFLFNTIETINWGIIEHLGFDNRVSRMLGNLSDVLKYALSDPKEKVTIKEEIAYTSSYASIMLERHKDEFEIIWDIDESLLKYDTIKLIIQPLLENSIHHGMKEKMGKCKIKIRVYSKKQKICIEIIDLGNGMSKERLDYVINSLESSDVNKDTKLHIGIKNVFKRLMLIYGEECTLKIESKEGWGTIVSMLIPKAISSNIIGDDN